MSAIAPPPLQYQTPQQSYQLNNFDPHNIINMALGSMIAEQMTNILQSSDGLTVSKISKMLTIMSMDEIRKSSMGYVKEFFNFIKSNHEFFKKMFVVIRDLIKSMIIWFKTTILKMECSEQIPQLVVCKKNTNDDNNNKSLNSIVVGVNAILPFMQILIDFVVKNPKYGSYKVSDNHHIDIQDLEKIVVHEKWNNIMINYNDLKIEINSVILMSFEQQRHKLNLIKFNNISHSGEKNKRTVDLDKITTLSDLISDEEIRKNVKENVLKIVPHAYAPEYNGIIGNTQNEYNISLRYINEGRGTATSNYIEINFLEFLQLKMKNMNDFSSLMELIYLMNVGQINFKRLKELLNDKNLKIIMLFDVEFKVSSRERMTYLCETPYSMCVATSAAAKKMKAIVGAFEKAEKNKKLCNFIKTTQPVETNNKIFFTISSEKYQKSQLYNEFKSFIKSISAHIEKKEIKEPVKSFVIMINEKIKKENVPNPDYETYLKQKKNLESLIKNSNGDNKDEKDDESQIQIINPDMHEDDISSELTYKKKNKNKKNMSSIAHHAMVDFMKRPIPTETIEKNITIKEVVVTEVNDVYKSLNTLYLRKDDSEKLKNVLEMFYDGKAIMEEMGIPNKLGILLHGLPGTGKSSAIAAIATYLKKNIYCVDFKTIKTNNDFMLMVSHVNKHCVNGGILTFEDFDAMGTVLHKRIKQKENDMNTISLHNAVDQPLTLDYILNVFQGSLTPSGFVFIATTNHLSVLDEALYRDGRFDIKIDMKLCDHYQIQSIYNKLMKRIVPPEIISRIKEDKWTPATIIFRVIHYIKGDHTDDIILQPFLEPEFDELML
jgi:ATP-dependent 26S proteasome regulatory subunit